MDCRTPDFSVHGVFQARTLEWIAILCLRDLSNQGIKPVSPASLALADGFFTTEPPGKPFNDYDEGINMTMELSSVGFKALLCHQLVWMPITCPAKMGIIIPTLEDSCKN